MNLLEKWESLSERIPERFRKPLKYVSYGVAYISLLLVFIYLSFPYDRFKHQLVTTYNQGQAIESDPIYLEVDSLSFSWAFPGFIAEGVRLKNSLESEGVVLSNIELARVRVQLLPLLIGTKAVSLKILGLGGEIHALAKLSGDKQSIEISLENINPGEVPQLAAAIGLPIEGSIDGEITLELPEGKLSMAKGDIDLNFDGVAIGDGKAKVLDAIALPRLDAGSIVFSASVVDGKVEVEDFSSSGGDLELSSRGSITLRDRFDASLVDQWIKFKFSDRYRGKTDTTKALFGAPGGGAPGIFDLDPKVKRSKGTDGSYGWKMAGPVAKMSFLPNSSVGANSAGATAPGE